MKVVAIDAMGGDFAPSNEVEGAFLAFGEESIKEKLKIIFVGDEAQINASLSKLPHKNFNYEIVHTDEVVTMDDDASAAIKTKKNSSMAIGFKLHKEGKADAFISAGNTGATMATGTIVLGRIKGVSRPTIGSFFPAANDRPVLVIDVGANVDAKARFFYEFAVMGDIYYRLMYNVANPKIGLLNVGEEPTKGTEAYQEANQLLQESKLNFVGNVEGRDIFGAKSDVVICDGFTGNVILKFAESIMGLLKYAFRNYADKSTINKIKIGLLKSTLVDVFKDFDYQEYGGVPLLGVNGVVIIGHGKSTPKAIKNMILRAVEMNEKDLNNKIQQALN